MKRRETPVHVDCPSPVSHASYDRSRGRPCQKASRADIRSSATRRSTFHVRYGVWRNGCSCECRCLFPSQDGRSPGNRRDKPGRLAGASDLRSMFDVRNSTMGVQSVIREPRSPLYLGKQWFSQSNKQRCWAGCAAQRSNQPNSDRRQIDAPQALQGRP